MSDNGLHCPRCGTEVFAYYQDGSPMCCVCEAASQTPEEDRP
jgi:uncharacterized Zn finger protein (UPF0148 family)